VEIVSVRVLVRRLLRKRKGEREKRERGNEKRKINEKRKGKEGKRNIKVAQAYEHTFLSIL
jgi:hypothetical protein